MTTTSYSTSANSKVYAIPLPVTGTTLDSAGRGSIDSILDGSPPQLTPASFMSTPGVQSQGKSSKEFPFPAPKLPNSFDALVELLQEKLRNCSLKDLDAVEEIRQMMEAYVSQDAEWAKYNHFDKYRYTRNLVVADDDYPAAEGPRWSLLVLCWGPGHQSPIHDHAGSHCVLKVLKGELLETRYEWPNGASEMHVVSEERRLRDQAAYMHDELGLHRISNPSQEEGAVSLHLYWPPIEMCQTFCESTGEARKTGKCVYFSVRGQRVTCCASDVAGLAPTDCPSFK